MKQILGVLIPLVVLVAIFVATVHALGWQTALGIWADALVVAALVVVAVGIVVGTVVGTQ